MRATARWKRAWVAVVLALGLGGCRDAPPSAATTVVAPDAPASCATPEGRFAALEGSSVSSELGELPPLTRAALACPAEAGALEIGRTTAGATLHLVRDGWRVDTLWQRTGSVTHVVFAPVDTTAPQAPSWPTLGLEAAAVDAMLEAWLAELPPGRPEVYQSIDEGDLDTFLVGPFTAPGARDEAVMATWGGLSHHDAWQLWLLGRDAQSGAWYVRRPIAADCSGSIDALDVDHDGRLELLVDSSCMHQGYDDGTLRLLSLADEHAWTPACQRGDDAFDSHDRVVLELPFGHAAGVTLDLVPLDAAPGVVRPLLVRAVPYVGPDEADAPAATAPPATLTRYERRGERYVAVESTPLP